MNLPRLLLSVVLSIAALNAASPAQAAQVAPRHVSTFDARPLRSLDLKQPSNATKMWDTLHLLGALQGLANRSQPRLYVFFSEEFGVQTDRFWLDWLRGEDGWLKSAQVQALPDLDAALHFFHSDFRGLVVYDPRVPATSNAASTAAGVESLLPVRFDNAPGSLYTHLTRDLRLPVRRWLVKPDGQSLFTGRGLLPDFQTPSSGSAKVDVYRWARLKYLDSGLCGAGYAAFYVDADWLSRPTNGAPDMNTLLNHDYFIARGAFFFDLSPWADEAPNDEPAQVLGGDKTELLRVLRALYERNAARITKIGGFPPWPFKYTSFTGGKHGGVETEWEFTRLISQFNAYHEADAANVGGMANASFFAHYPLRPHYAQPNPRPSLAEWKARGFVDAQNHVANRCFVAHYVGDYDAPSWMYKAIAAFFSDPKRGQVPLAWAFDPNLADRAPQALAYAYRHASPNDFVITGDSGAGYLNARALTVRPDSHLPSGLDAWAEHNLKYLGRWDMSITGFVLDGAGGASGPDEWRAYARFSPDGLGTHFEPRAALLEGVPSSPERDLPNDIAQAAAQIAHDAAGSDHEPIFQWRRSILKSPGWYADLSQELRDKHAEARVEVVDPYTFFGLLKLHLSEKTTAAK